MSSKVQIPLRVDPALLQDFDKAVSVMCLEGVNNATGRRWSREACISHAMTKFVTELRDRCGGIFPQDI
jgi:kynureninase